MYVKLHLLAERLHYADLQETLEEIQNHLFLFSIYQHMPVHCMRLGLFIHYCMSVELCTQYNTQVYRESKNTNG